MKTPVYERPTFVPWDIEVARSNFGANCGPASFAAFMETEVCRVISYFPHFEYSNWTNLTQMLRAVKMAGFNAEVHRRGLPAHGLALIQWLGPWTERDFFSPWSLSFTHWVTVVGPWMFDYTAKGWQRLDEWSKDLARQYISHVPRATGWAVKYGIEVRKKTESARWLPAEAPLALPVLA